MAAALAPGVFPTIEPEAAHAEPGATAAAANQIIDADMIASGRVKKAANLTDAQGVGKGLISGHVFMTGTNGNPGSTIDNGNIPMDGVTVYAQFRDKDGSYSPIFSAKTHTLPDVVGGNGGKGTYAFGSGNKGITWTDKLGKEHTWAARIGQKHRIWVEPSTNDRGNRVEMFRQANGFVPGSFNGLVDYPLGSFAAADGNIQLTAAFLREIPPSHESSYMAAKGDKLVEDPKGPISNAAEQLRESNVLSGRVWLETGHADGGIVASGPSMNGYTDVAADGYTVYASTLTKDGAAANAKLHETYKNNPNKLAEETKKMLEDHPEYIAKTVYGKTDANGNYSLRFGDYTDKNQTREDILNPNHVFVWVENKDGVVQSGYTGFHTPVFQRFNAGGNFRPSAIPAENQTITARVEDQGKPRYGKPVNSIYNMNYAVMTYTPVSITADYNATDKPAAPGTTVTPEFNGDLSSLPSRIEWRDANGKVLKTCKLDQSKSIKSQVSACTFDIPADANKGDFYNVVVVSGDNDVAAWSVLVTDKNSDSFEPKYEDKLVVPGEETKSTPTFTDKDGKDVKAPEGSKFSIPEDFKAPEGYEVKIDENTGEITVTFPDGSKLNKDTVEEFDVPVTVTYPDGSKDDAKAKFKLDTDGDGKPDTEDEDDDNDGIPDGEDDNPKVPNQDNEKFEPGYEDGSGKPGEDVKVPAPGFKDKDGKDTKAPEGTTFKPGEGAPDGVKVDEKTGEVTVPVPEGAKPGDKITVPVVVTYPDGTTDTVDVTVTVDEPDAPTPAPEAKDNEKFEPGYEDGSGKPGEDVKVPAPGFKDKDGKDTKAPEGTTFKPGEGAPDGVKVDENTGEITVPVPEDAKPGDKITVPVEVTYPDGTKDEVDVTVTVTEKDAKPVTPPAPRENNPSLGATADDPASCEIPPFVTVEETEGVEYKVTVEGKELKADADGKYVYDYGQTVKVEAFPTKGYTFPEGAQTTWSYTTEQNEVCEVPDSKDNEKFEPGYEDGSGKPGEDVKVPAPGFKDKDGKDTKAPEGTKFTPGDNAPDGVKVDENTGEITVPVPEGAEPGDKITVPVDVTYPDGSTDTVDVTVTVDEPDAPAEKPDWKHDSGKPGDKVEIPNTGGPVEDGTTVETEGPGKAEIDEDGKITVDINDDAKPGDKVVVIVKDKDGNEIDRVVVEVEQPDTPAPAEKDKDKFEPGYEDGSGKPGDDVKVPAPTVKDKDGKETKAPEGTKFKPGEGAPEGVEVDSNTGEITVKVPEGAKPGDKITVPVDVTYPDGTKDTVDVTVTVEEPDAPEEPGDKDAEKFEPEYEDGFGKPGDDVTIDEPGFKDKDGKDTTPPEDTKFTPGDDAPEGVKVDENTGELTVPVPEDAKPGDEITVPVDVTYPDRTTYTVDATVTVTDPDAKPEWGDGEGEPGDKVTVPNEGGDVPDGSTVETEGQGKAEIDENGNLVVDIDKDAKPGDKIVIVVKDPEGNTIDESTVTVTEPSKPDTKQNEEFEPGYEDGSGKPGEDVKVPAPEFKDKDGKETKAPEGTKFTPGDNAPDGVTVDPNTGEITVPVPEDAKPGDTITVPVDVTYPDGSKDTVDVTVTVEKPDAPAEKPDWKDDSGKPGDNVVIPNEGGKVEDGTTVETEGPGKAEIDEDGKITVDIHDDAKPGDKVEVVVEDKDGNEIDRVVVEVEKPDAPAEKPDWKDDSGKPGDKVEIPNEGGKVEDGTTVETEGPGKAEIDKDGNITVDINDDAKPGDKVVVIVKDRDGNEIDRVVVEVEKPEAPAEKPDWKDDSGKPGDNVVIPNEGGKVEDGTTVEVEGPGKAEIDEDGKITVDIHDDAKPGDKVEVVVEDKDGKVIDEVTVTVEKPGDKQPEAPAPAEKPDWNDDSGKPGDDIVIPNEGGKVPEGSTVETEGPGKAEIDKDGNIRVDIHDEAKPGDKVKVVVKDKDGKVIDEVTVHVKDPNKSDAENYQPKWNDSTIKPGDTITLPNIGDKLPNGTTLEIKGKDLPKGWGVQIDKNGAIKVTAPSWAKPGDTVKIPVHITYPDGSTEVVYFTVTVTGDADKGGSNDKGGPLPRTGVEVGAALAAATALIAGGIALIARSRRRNN